MTHKYLTSFSTQETPQSQPIPGREHEMSVNNAGGYAFPVDDWTRLNRFLVLGAEGGTYYVKEQALVQENATAVLRCIQQDGVRVVQKVVEISVKGRAPKNDPALFVLAMAAGFGNPDTKKAAFAALPAVARIPTHLFHFATYMQQFRGWGRSARTAVANWYLIKPLQNLALHMVKYQQRDGWSNADLLRLAHPKTSDTFRNQIFKYVVDNELPTEENQDNQILFGFEQAKRAQTAKDVVALIHKYKLPRECVPTNFLNSPNVWEALLDVDMPIHALVRNLGKMTSVELLKPLSAHVKTVVQVLLDAERIKKARLHPIALLAAQRVYQQGHGEKGSLTWNPVSQIVDALDNAFYLAFDSVEPTNKAYMLALDISGSMGWTPSGIPNINCREASAVIAMATARVEPNYLVMGFSDSLVHINISPKMRLTAVVNVISKYPFGGTNASLPARFAKDKNLAVEAFVLYTDNESWAGKAHTTQALQQFRQHSGIPAKQVVVSMASNGFTVADPKDAGQMDVVGFSTDVPAVIADFVRG